MRTAVALLALALASGCAHRGTWRARGVVPGNGVPSTEEVQALREDLAGANQSLAAHAVVQEELHARIAELEHLVEELPNDLASAESWDLYEVRKGQSLWLIADELWADPYMWVRLLDANRDRLDDPDKIYPGQLLRIPPEPSAKIP
jgi:nucleoid-associated protein YgaU